MPISRPVPHVPLPRSVLLQLSVPETLVRVVIVCRLDGVDTDRLQRLRDRAEGAAVMTAVVRLLLDDIEELTCCQDCVGTGRDFDCAWEVGCLRSKLQAELARLEGHRPLLTRRPADGTPEALAAWVPTAPPTSSPELAGYRLRRERRQLAAVLERRERLATTACAWSAHDHPGADRLWQRVGELEEFIAHRWPSVWSRLWSSWAQADAAWIIDDHAAVERRCVLCPGEESGASARRAA